MFKATSSKLSVNMVQISFLLLGLFVLGNRASPTYEEIQEIYVDTCQESCSIVKNTEESQECREKFCPNYSSYLLEGVTNDDLTPSHVSNNEKEVNDFCATWMIHLIQELGWQKRIHLNLKECNCAAGKTCLVK